MTQKTARQNWRQDPLETTPPARGSGSFLKDRGYPDPTQTRIKFELVRVIRAVVESRNLRQVDVVDLISHYAPEMGISQPDVSHILRGNVSGYSESRLLMVLAALGNDVWIVVKPVKGQGQISVHDTAIV